MIFTKLYKIGSEFVTETFDITYILLWDIVEKLGGLDVGTNDFTFIQRQFYYKWWQLKR